MRQFKQAASHFVQSIALSTALSKSLALRRPARRIIMLHGVGGADLPAADFKAGLVWLSRHFRVVPLSTMMNDIAANKPQPAAGEVAITFDDGLRNQLRVAFPILEELGIPATIFVCPGLIDSHQWLWNHEVRARLRRLSDPARDELARLLGAPSGQIESMIGWLKGQVIDQRMAAEQTIRDATPNFRPTHTEHEACDLMSWEELALFDPEQITIGSHTVTHPILPTLDDMQLRHELQQSRHMIETKLGREADLFCYPNGSNDARVRNAVAQIYGAAVTTEEGIVPTNADLFAIPRIAASARLSLLAWRMHRPCS
ncbi:polysaccharide deacetylase [mine drainage metagenome]|uniref:Polysaccharide deacetylase n=1 Tax=mine drainage metagenome TaxID=410659 RepID=A0A1J5Q436_9ZZZZ